MNAKVEWTDEAICMADDALEIARTYGVKTYRNLAENFEKITRRLAVMPRMGCLEEGLAFEDGEYRYLHANKEMKVLYRVYSDEYVVILAVVHDNAPANELMLYI